MKNSRARKICEKWEEIEAEDPDKSTEYIMQRVCDWASDYLHFDVDCGHVVEAMEQMGVLVD